jgi:hypothetical protein
MSGKGKSVAVLLLLVACVAWNVFALVHSKSVMGAIWYSVILVFLLPSTAGLAIVVFKSPK